MAPPAGGFAAVGFLVVGTTCDRMGCAARATVVFGADPGRMLVVMQAVDPATLGDLRPGILCDEHAGRLTVPRGWTLDDQREVTPRLFRVPAPPPDAIPDPPPRRAASSPPVETSAPTSTPSSTPSSAPSSTRPPVQPSGRQSPVDPPLMDIPMALEWDEHEPATVIDDDDPSWEDWTTEIEIEVDTVEVDTAEVVTGEDVPESETVENVRELEYVVDPDVVDPDPSWPRGDVSPTATTSASPPTRDTSWGQHAQPDPSGDHQRLRGDDDGRSS
jgi:hypothetical protein